MGGSERSAAFDDVARGADDAAAAADDDDDDDDDDEEEEDEDDDVGSGNDAADSNGVVCTDGTGADIPAPATTGSGRPSPSEDSICASAI